MALRTEGGSPSAQAREEKAALSGGRFPVFDKKSAMAALRLRGRTKSKEERRKVIMAAMKFAPEAAREAMRRDREAGLV